MQAVHADAPVETEWNRGLHQTYLPPTAPLACLLILVGPHYGYPLLYPKTLNLQNGDIFESCNHHQRVSARRLNMPTSEHITT